MKIEINQNDTFLGCLEKIKASPEKDVTLVIPAGHSLLDNILNLKLLKAQALKAGKELTLTSSDEAGSKLLSSLFAEGAPVPTTTSVVTASIPKATISFWDKIRPHPGSRFKLNRFALFFAGFLGLGVGLMVLYAAVLYYVPRATVSLKFNQDALTKSVIVSLGATGVPVDLDKKIIPAQKLVLAATASAQIKTTGQKTEGDPATGTVIIYNKTDNPKTFAKNTLLALVTTVSGDWLFTLDSSVTVPERQVASVSATPSGETTIYNYGQAKVAVTAKSIGEKYNLPSGSQFNIGNENANNYLAKSESDFSGGRETLVAVVTQADHDNLQNTIQGKLFDDLNLKITAAIPEGMLSATGGAALKITASNFDHGIGETADTLSLTATGIGITYAFKADEAKAVWQSQVQSSLPTNYVLSTTEKDLSLTMVPDTTDTPTPQLLVKGVSFVVPKYLAEDIQKTLAGKSLTDAKNFLDALSGISTVKIDVWPPILGLADQMPRRPAAITVVIEKP